MKQSGTLAFKKTDRFRTWFKKADNLKITDTGPGLVLLENSLEQNCWLTRMVHNFVHTDPQKLVPKPIESPGSQLPNGFGTVFWGSIWTKLGTNKVWT